MHPVMLLLSSLGLMLLIDASFESLMDLLIGVEP